MAWPCTRGATIAVPSLPAREGHAFHPAMRPPSVPTPTRPSVYNRGAEPVSPVVVSNVVRFLNLCDSDDERADTLPTLVPKNRRIPADQVGRLLACFSQEPARQKAQEFLRQRS